MSDETYTAFMKEYIKAPSTREAIDAIYTKYYPNVNKTPYPDEWYEDKDNRVSGRPTGHLRYENRKMIWVKH
jgi:hypothetical protein